MFDDLFRSSVPPLIEGLQRPVDAELLFVGIRGLGNTVRIKEQFSASFQLDLILFVFHAFHTADDKTVAVLDQFKRAVGAFHDRLLMSRVGGRENTGLKIQDAEPNRDEHLLAVVLADLVIHSFKSRLGISVHDGIILDEDL